MNSCDRTSFQVSSRESLACLQSKESSAQPKKATVCISNQWLRAPTVSQLMIRWKWDDTGGCPQISWHLPYSWGKSRKTSTMRQWRLCDQSSTKMGSLTSKWDKQDCTERQEGRISLTCELKIWNFIEFSCASIFISITVLCNQTFQWDFKIRLVHSTMIAESQDQMNLKMSGNTA